MGTETITPTKMAFETRYSDDSGVEYAVRYDSTQHNDSDGGAVIELEHINAVDFPASKIEWLIACLKKIKQEADGDL